MEMTAANVVSSFASCTDNPGSGGRCVSYPAASYYRLADTSSPYWSPDRFVRFMRKPQPKSPDLYVLLEGTAYAHSNTFGSSISSCPVINFARVNSGYRLPFSLDQGEQDLTQNGWLYGTSEPILTCREGNHDERLSYLCLVLPILPLAAEWNVVPAGARTVPPVDKFTSLFRRNVEETEQLLGITRSQLAQALLVERATVYQWFRGAQPRPKTIERLDNLLAIAKAWQKSNMGSARTAWHLQLRGADRSLGELLASEPLEVGALQSLIESSYSGNEPEAISPSSELEGFPAQNAVEERRRRRKMYPPTYSSEG